ncbi:hypothetical protein MGWOODY_Clf289 [hydrothermal vent metagenome]|uniref:Uncharacterized protein n=1 Tax=hydrothermal vent metagenome TaxID=652676 RepID=A0A160VBZ3_9ZZZZ
MPKGDFMLCLAEDYERQENGYVSSNNHSSFENHGESPMGDMSHIFIHHGHIFWNAFQIDAAKGRASRGVRPVP